MGIWKILIVIGKIGHPIKIRGGATFSGQF
jgi:hypothetical protein